MIELLVLFFQKSALFGQCSPNHGEFPDEVPPDIDFIDEASVLCSSCKITFVDAGNLQMIMSKF